MRDPNLEGEGAPVESAEEDPLLAEREYPVDRLRRRIASSTGNRPMVVYLVLVAGAATLLLLLVIVWISATGGGVEERPICTAITTSDAEAAILAGQVERIKVLVDRDSPLETLTGIVLELTDGTCRQPAQGADVRNDLFQILGVVEHYNNFGAQRVRVLYQRQEIQDELLSTATFTPLPTAPVTETATPTATLPPPSTSTPEPTATDPPPTRTPTRTPVAAVSTATINTTATPATATSRSGSAQSPTATP